MPMWGRVAGLSTAGAAAGGAWWYVSQQLTAARKPGGAPPVDSALQPGETLVCPLLRAERLTRDTARYRFALPSPAHALGLPGAASHVLAVDGAHVSRAYTPVTGLPALGDARGHFDLIVKAYPNGYFSEQFARLRPGGWSRICPRSSISHVLFCVWVPSRLGVTRNRPREPKAPSRVRVRAGGGNGTPSFQRQTTDASLALSLRGSSLLEASTRWASAGRS